MCYVVPIDPALDKQLIIEQNKPSHHPPPNPNHEMNEPPRTGSGTEFGTTRARVTGTDTRPSVPPGWGRGCRDRRDPANVECVGVKSSYATICLTSCSVQLLSSQGVCSPRSGQRALDRFLSILTPSTVCRVHVVYNGQVCSFPTCSRAIGGARCLGSSCQRKTTAGRHNTTYVQTNI